MEDTDPVFYCFNFDIGSSMMYLSINSDMVFPKPLTGRHNFVWMDDIEASSLNATFPHFFKK